MLLSRRVPRWLQVTIRFLEINEEGRGGPGSAARRKKRDKEESSVSRADTVLYIRFRGVSARYTSFNRIRMQCCGKFHLSEARGSERVNEKNGGGRDAARESGSRCDFVSTLRTPSRALRSPCSAATFAYPLLAFTLLRKCNRGTPRERHDNRNLFTTLQTAAL